jgi:hypothetical protein
MSAIRHWLTGLGFEQFAEAFEQNQIDLDIAASCVFPRPVIRLDLLSFLPRATPAASPQP